MAISEPIAARTPDGEFINYWDERLRVAGCTPLYEMVRKVVIEVSGGVAEVTDCPDDVVVEIIDHDNLAADQE